MNWSGESALVGINCGGQSHSQVLPIRLERLRPTTPHWRTCFPQWFGQRRLLGNVVYRRVLTQLFELRIVCHLFKPNLLRNLTVHTEHRSDFLLSKQQNLQHEMVAFLTSTAHAGLAHQDEARQDDGFDGYQGS